MKSDKEIEDFIQKFTTIYEEGYKKIIEAEDIAIAFYKTCTSEDFQKLSKIYIERLRNMTGPDSSWSKVINSLERVFESRFNNTPKKDDMN